MKKIEDIEVYKEFVKEHINGDGMFPDSILADAIWPLTYCNKHFINGEMFWSFIDNTPSE